MFTGNVVAWFEIPTRNFARAQHFYESVLDMPLQRDADARMAVFPFAPPNASGALIDDPARQPSSEGSTVYLALPDLVPALARAIDAGAEVLVPRTGLPDAMGVYAQFRDSEGNRIGLWSPA